MRLCNLLFLHWTCLLYTSYENGKLKILEVTKDNALNIREESGLPTGLKLDVYSDYNQLLFQVPINKIENFERPAWEDRTEDVYKRQFFVCPCLF